MQDRINIFIEGHNELKIALKSHKSYFMNEVLGVRLNLESQKSEFVNSIKIDGHLTKIGIDLAN